MASVSDFVKDLTPREREALDAVLRPGEQLRWATRPLCRFAAGELAGFVLLELLCAVFLICPGILGYVLVVHPPSDSLVQQLMVLGFLSLFVLAGLGFSTYPLREYRRRRHTLYLLTNHRALVLTPGNVLAYPLHENLLRTRICRPGGGGDLLFSVSRDGYGSGNQGFIHLPDLLEAHRELNAAINALLDAAEQHAKRDSLRCF